jgi:hypothetical protein
VIDNIQQRDSELQDTQGRQFAGLLDTHANRLSMRTLKRLEDARLQAVRLHEQKMAGNVHNGGSTLGKVFFWADHHRAVVTGLVLATVVAGLLLVQTSSFKVDTDTMLLGSELPPEAFVDRGFEPSLNRRVNFDETQEVRSIKL